MLASAALEQRMKGNGQDAQHECVCLVLFKWNLLYHYASALLTAKRPRGKLDSAQPLNVTQHVSVPQVARRMFYKVCGADCHRAMSN